jgi:serine/threonine protein kinase/tetratricopeptide (TPR) repeat protein
MAASATPPIPPPLPQQPGERWARIKAVFVEAFEVSESERGAFVARACDGDATLRQEVESLLASEKAAASFLEAPAAGLLGQDAPASPRLEPGARLGAYEVTAFLSAGGMGEVYRARHTVLGRHVAIKTVSARSAEPTANRRLVREAQHAAILNHPNICTIFEVDEAEGLPFIVMELIEGRPLRERLHENLPALDDALRIGSQVADALEHAHGHGIVHRDLKSLNVVVDETGKAIVLDFGLAKRISQVTTDRSRDSTLTAAGALAGTLSHMAPEVLLGDQADARSDVWALGVLLYELVTGELPFTGRTPFETSSAILSEPPRRLRNRVPLALRLVIERCLAKNPNARYQHAADVRDALDWIARRNAWPLVGRLLVSTRWRRLSVWSAAAALVVAAVVAAPRLRGRFGSAVAGKISTLAFVPMETAASDSTSVYYTQGITESLINRLGAIAQARVLAPTSAARAAKTATSRAGLARSLNADALVEGRLRRSPGRIAVDVRLVEPTRGRVVWSDTFERDTRQVLALEDDIVRALAAEIRVTMRPRAQVQLGPSRAVNPNAYETYLRGRFEWNKRTRASLERAVAHFTQAIDLDPTYAPSHAALADCYNQFGTQLVGTGSPRDFRPRAAAEAIRALQIDPYSAEAHAALGYVRHYEWQWAEAEREFRRAIELNPSYPYAHLWYANLLMSRRRLDEALQQVGLARELDPFSLIINSNLGWVLIAAGRNAEAIAQLRHTLTLDSTYVQAHMRLSGPLVALGRFDEARREAEMVVRLTNGSTSAAAGLAAIDAAAGRTADARRELAILLERAHTEYVPPGAVAGVYAKLGDTLNQDAWLMRAYEERSNALAYLLVDTARTWRTDATVLKLIAAVGLQ